MLAKIALLLLSPFGLLGAALALLGTGQGSLAAERAWQAAGFGGAGNFAIVRSHPTQPGVVYATSDVGGVFRSTDHGQTWTVRNRGLGNFEVSSFAIDPFDGDTLYAGTGAFFDSDKAGLYISHNAGATWSHLPSSARNGITFRLHRTPGAIGLDPSRPGVLVVGSRKSGIWRSTDHGESWTSVFAAPMTSVHPPRIGTGVVGIQDDPRSEVFTAPITTVVFDPAADGTVYAGIFGVGVIRSTASGAAGTWSALSNGLPLQPIVRDIVVGADRTVYIAVGEKGVYRSADQGESWRPANDNLPLDDYHVFSLAADPTDPDIVYAALQFIPNRGNSYSGVWKTTDGGKSWSETGDVALDSASNATYDWIYNPVSALDVSVDPREPNRVVFAGSWGLYRSEDGGAHWQSAVRGAQNTCVTDLTVDATTEPETLYATHLDAGLLASTDKGASWRAVMPTNPRTRDVYAGHHWRILVTGSGSEKSLFLSTAPWRGPENKLLKRTATGRWREVFSRPVGDRGRGLGRTALAAHPHMPNTLYWAQDGGEIFRSRDGGETWSLTPGQPASVSFNDILVDDAGRIYAATLWDGLWLSTDDGNSWRQVLPTGIWDLDWAPGTVYAAGADGVLYRSHRGGEAGTWRALTHFNARPDPDGTGMNGLAVGVDPYDPAHLLFSRRDTWHYADSGEGVYESRDAGATWTLVDAGLGLPGVTTFAFSRDGDAFAGTYCGGIWRLPPIAADTQ